MTGIVSCGAYIPYYRLKKETAAAAFGKKGAKGEKSVAYCDEDSITMAAAAAINAMAGESVPKLEAVYFASSTAPYREKQSSTVIAAVLDCGTELRTGDFANTLRAGSTAMNAALDLASLQPEPVLVTMSDTRQGAADGKFETDLGDGAAAFLLGSRDVLAELNGRVSFSKDAIDIWRADDDRFVRDWDVRYANTQLYTPLVQCAVKELLKQENKTPSDYSSLVLYGHDEKNRTNLALKLGFTQEQIQPSYYSEIGNCGNAAAGIMLCSALESAKPGDRILFVTYGEGCDAFSFTVTDKASRAKKQNSVEKNLRHKDNTLPYGKYLKWKGMVSCEPQKRPAQERSALPDYNRNYKKNYALYGCRCRECGTIVFPPQRVCVHCHAVDSMEPYRFFDKTATVRTFTIDGLSLSLDSPNILVVIEFEGGGKMMTYLVDCPREDIHVGMKVRPSFRKMFEANGVQTYFWKVVSAEEEQ